MQFSTLYAELGNRLGVYDITVSDDLTKLKRWINMGIQYICGKYLWSFQLTEEIIQTVTDYTTGTVTVAAGGTTVTFSAVIAASKTGQYIQFASSNDWYQITAHTAGAATATISPAALADNTAATYTIRKLLYTTTTPLIQILDMKQLVTPARSVSISPVVADYFLPLYQSTGTPYYYIMSSPSSTGTPQFSFVYSPDTAMNIMVRGIKNLTDLSSDTDTPVIPVAWHDAILNVAAFYGFQGMDDNRADTELLVAEKRIADMKNNYVMDLGRHRIVGSSDQGLDIGLAWVLPSNYGPEIS